MNTVSFTATDNQVAEMCALASNASSPFGMGFLQYDPTTVFKASDFLKGIKKDEYWCNLDYVEGRMVKLSLWRGDKKNEWKYVDFEPRPDYQSWVTKYPTYPDLIKAAGIAL